VARTMPVTFISFPRAELGGPVHAVDPDEDQYDMDVEDEGDQIGFGGRLTCPGETLTSTQAFMRYAASAESRNRRDAHRRLLGATALTWMAKTSLQRSRAPWSASTSSSPFERSGRGVAIRTRLHAS
jgi:hypothetical protein